MALTRQDYLDMLYSTGWAVSQSPASMSIKDFANQTGLNQTLSDYQDAYAEAVLSGSKAGQDILAQGDKAFSSQWYEILQNALRAAVAARATGGELGTDFTEALSTTLAAMQEASAGATTQQNAYVNLANQIATALAEAGVNSMSAFQQQGANLAQSYPALMEALAMQDSNLLAQFLGLLNESTPGVGYTTAPTAPTAPTGTFSPDMFFGNNASAGTPILQNLAPGVAGPVLVTSGNPLNVSNPAIRPDPAVLKQLAQNNRDQIAAELAFGPVTNKTYTPAESQMGQLLSSVLAGQQVPDPQIDRTTTRLPSAAYTVGADKPAYAHLSIPQALQNLYAMGRDSVSRRTTALQEAQAAQSLLAATPVTETEGDRKQRLEKLYNNRGLAAQIAAARANAAKQSAAQQATALAQAVRPTTTGSSVSTRNPSTGINVAPIVTALNKAAAAAAANSSARPSSRSNSSSGSYNQKLVAAIKSAQASTSKNQTAANHYKNVSSGGSSGSGFSVAPKVPTPSNTIGSIFNSYKPSTSYAGYSSSDLAKRKTLAKQGEME